MTEDKNMYCIYLEDYSQPCYMPGGKRYFGTREDISKLMFALSANECLRERYSEMIEAFDRYDLDPEQVHNVAGREYPILVPAQELSRWEFSLKEHKWICWGRDEFWLGNAYPMTADGVEVSRVLFRCEDQLFRCVRLGLKEFGIRVPGDGWCGVNNLEKRGFPRMYQLEDEWYRQKLYSIEKTYTMDQKEEAMADMGRLDQLNLDEVCKELLGGHRNG